jgi:hypothetical protein
MIRIFLFGIPVTFIFCVRTCGKFWLTSGKIGDHTQLNALGLVSFCVCLIMYCFDLQCFLWLLTDSISLSLRCIAIVWTPQLFRMWDRFWALPRCTNMPWTRIRSPRWRNRVAFGASIDAEKSPGYASGHYRSSVAKVATWALHTVHAKTGPDVELGQLVYS